jgi:osmoprotectant transport system ATP-binding protein
VIAVNDISFQVEKGHTMCIIGPSGCGKTTILKMMNRLLDPSFGEVRINNQNIRHVNPIELRRSIGYIIQSGGLFPHYTVEKNIAIVPGLLRWDNERINQAIREMLDLVNLSPHKYMHRYPAELSGGEQQRVGIARALAANPPIILIDEPFSALDPITRKQLQDEFLNLKQKVRKTMIFVTHDMKEAFQMGNEILVMNEGRVQQHDTPDNLVKYPVNEFVQKFIESQME